jgi:hypothetical protein
MSDTQFRCPQCGGRHFGSTPEQRPDGSIWKLSEDCHDEFNVDCKWRGEKMVCLVEATRTEISTLKEVWLLIDGNEMPDDIASHPIEIVRKSIHWLRQGVYPVIPKTPVVIPVSADESMAEWDGQDDKLLNSYGS